MSAVLDRVTITGADDTVSPWQLWELSKDFPFVEWALLFKRNDQRGPRWPTAGWLDVLYQQARTSTEPQPRFALHLCGRALASFLVGKACSDEHGDLGRREIPAGLLQLVRRVQLNTHGAAATWNADEMYTLWQYELPLVQIIQQIDGAHGQTILDELRAELVEVFPFYDLSHGAGVTPDEWPKNEAAWEIDGSPLYCGYGGGLGIDNLAEQIPLIAQAAGGRFWVDMETKVRSWRDGRDVFDLDKVRQCLGICAPLVGRPL